MAMNLRFQVFKLTKLFIILLLLILCTNPSYAKKRIAVLDFDTAYSRTYWIAPGYNVGFAVPEQLVTGLVKQDIYTVIERDRLKQVLAEQSFTNSKFVNPQQAITLGKMLGVDAIIVGSVTEYGFDDNSIATQAPGVGAGFIPGVGGILTGSLFGSLKKSKGKAVVAIDARVVNTTTGEIIGVVRGKAEADRSSYKVGATVQKQSSNFRETLLSEATQKAVDQMVQQLASLEPNMSITKQKIEGKIADITDSNITITVGSESGLKKDDKLVVCKVLKTITNPDTKEIIRQLTEDIGEIVIIEPSKGFSDAKLIKGELDQLKPGDLVKYSEE